MKIKYSLVPKNILSPQQFCELYKQKGGNKNKSNEYILKKYNGVYRFMFGMENELKRQKRTNNEEEEENKEEEHKYDYLQLISGHFPAYFPAYFLAYFSAYFLHILGVINAYLLHITCIFIRYICIFIAYSAY